jgi:rhamnosyltransferase
MNVLVILASYNGRKYIKDQIDSILSQEGVNVLLKIYDDCSNDGTLDFLFSEYSSKLSQIHISKNRLPSGSAANNFIQAIRNISTKEIEKYDFIAFADQDDIWLPNKLLEAGHMLRTDNSYLYFSNLTLWNQESNTRSLIKKSYPQRKYDYLFEGGSAGCTCVMNKELVYLVKEYVREVDCIHWAFFSHDWFIYFIARTNNLKVFIDNRAFILYRIHETNVHGQLNTFSLYAMKERLKLIINGWYYFQSKGFMKLLPKHSIEAKIYDLYTRNYFTRIFVICRYNFSLMRSNKKAIQFFFLSALPLKIKK